MTVKALLALVRENGALVVHAHPFREARSIDHIRLYPRSVQAVEVYNANRSEFENRQAQWYTQSYGLIPLAGSDIHGKESHGNRCGMRSQTPITDEQDFVKKVLTGELQVFHKVLLSIE